MPKFNNWNVPYRAIRFFEDLLRSHNKVESFERTDDIFFKITRPAGLSPVNALLINVYTVGLADVFRAKEEFPELDCIVTSSIWNGYTREAKEHALDSELGLFVVSEFSRALREQVPYRYVKKDRDGNPIYHFKAA
jgi:hypothetical protein